ncbi:MAG: ABC transporter permease [Spirochaetota bacterium]
MKNYMIIIKLAWRNIWRNKRRTVLTLLTIVVGCAMIILMNAFARGGHDQMIDDAVSLNTGHVQVHEKGFWDSQTIDYAFKPTDQLIRILDDQEAITGYSRRVHAGVLVALDDVSRGAMVQGIEPGREKSVTDLHEKILPGGRYLEKNDSTHVVMGDVLAKNLKVKVGDRISILSQGFDGSIAAEHLDIVGIFKSGNQEYDRTLMLIPLSQAMKTFSMMGYINSMVIRLDDPGRMDEVMAACRKATQEYSYPMEVMGWKTLMPELVQFIVMDDVAAWIFDFILFMVVGFGILNTIQMSVFERTREFGVMLSIGTQPSQVVAIVLTETVFITLLGILLGSILGIGSSMYLHYNPIDYSAYADEIAIWGISTTVFPATVTPLNVTVTGMFTFILGILFSIFPARRAAKLDPVEAIRTL